jgi:hypothetical protein
VPNCTDDSAPSGGACTSYYAGKSYSAAIVSARGSDAGAAYYCENLNINGQTDWYLPSIPELQVLYTNRTAIGNFYTGSPPYYWTSTEAGPGHGAWIGQFNSTYQQSVSKTFYTNLHIRCVRR